MTRFTPNIFSLRWWKKSWQELQLVVALVRDPDVPFYLKAIPFIIGLYLLSPFDIVPGFLPIVGQLDDTALLLIGLKLFVRLAPDEVVQRHALDKGNPMVAADRA